MSKIARTATQVAAFAVPLALVLGSTGVALANPGKGHKARTYAAVLTAKPSAVSGSSTAVFSWADPTATGYTFTYTCSRDGLAAVACTSPLTYSGLADRQHSFSLKTTSKLVSNGATSKPATTSWSWKVDTLAPAAPMVNPIASPTSNTNATVSFSDADATATFTCSLDGAPAVACTSPTTYSGLADGVHTVVVTATDPAGNHSSKTITWTVDHTAPDLPDVTGPISPTNSTSASVSFTGAAGATFRCRLDQGVEAACVSPWTSGGAVLADGAHVLVVTPVDSLNNRGAAGNALWVVDTLAPTAPRLVTGPSPLTSLLDVAIEFADLDPSVVRHTCSLDGAAAVACDSGYTVANPIDGAHTVAVRSFDAAGNVSPALNVAWTEDSVSLPPSVSFGPSTPTTDTHPSFDFGPTDPGTVSYECAVDASAFTACVPGVLYDVTADGDHTFYVRALDGATPANVSPATPFGWTLDTSAPTTAPQASGSTSTGPATTVPVLTFGTTDPTTSGFVCSVDGGAFVTCSSGFQPVVGDGAHTVVVAPVDLAGNQGTNPLTYTFTTDTTGPATQSTGSSSLGSLTAPPALMFSSPDPDVASYLCSVDGGAYTACATGFTPTVGEGDHAVSVKAVDTLGNVGTQVVTYTFTIDTTAPAAAPVASGTPVPSTPVSTPPVLTDGSTEAGVTGFVCSVDGGAFTPCASPFTPAVATDGTHTVLIKAVDAAGNQSAETLSYTFTTDTVAPTGAPVAGGGTPPQSGTVTTVPTLIFTSSNPDAQTFACSIDGGPFVPCASGYQPQVGDGAHTITVVLTDSASNQGSGTIDYSFTLDTTSPTALTGIPATLVAPTVVTFSEDVHGVTAASTSLQLADGGTVATTLVCRTFPGTVVPCTSAVRTATLTPVKPLVPGQRYRPVVTSAVTDLVGNTANVTGTVFRAQLVQQESSAVVGQAWRKVVTRTAIGGSWVVQNRAGATASNAFTGTAVTWYTATGPSMGTVKVYIDGVYKGTVNNYATAVHTKVGRVVKGLTNKAHVLKLVVTGRRGATAGKGSSIVVDAVKVGTRLTATPSLITTWGSSASTLASGGRYAASDQVTDYAGLTFRGTRITWTTITGPAMGKAKVYVDGVLRATVDNYAAASHGGVRRVWALTDKVHTIKIVVLGTHRTGSKGNSIVLDSLTVG